MKLLSEKKSPIGLASQFKLNGIASRSCTEGVECRLGSSIIKTASPKKSILQQALHLLFEAEVVVAQVAMSFRVTVRCRP
jgi:hypothetical protein